jgi:hypothetical protein
MKGEERGKMKNRHMKGMNSEKGVLGKKEVWFNLVRKVASTESSIVESSVQTNGVLRGIGLSGLRSRGGALCCVLCGIQVCACVSQLVRYESQALLGGGQHACL